ncbi:MAG: hypothetical protein HKN47_23425 [Pirellulaceae bacterium]|nr:hypothetical protein [Pirellulaceae bacterium]
MLVTPESLRENQRHSLIAAFITGVVIVMLGFVWPVWFFALPLPAIVYWWFRRKLKRRAAVIATPFPEAWERILQSHVEYFRALEESQRQRFRQMVQVFLDETLITGIRTEVDDLTEVLVAASAVIPVFGFDDWDYTRLGEVLIYPGRFGENFETAEGADRHTLGMIGVNHLSGVMILSKPDLIAGFENTTDKRNVGIHEFAHLVDQADGSVDGLPAGISRDVVGPWLNWVAGELESRPDTKHHIDDYAYTNDAEYFAVLSEYFFESPELLFQKDPATYAMLKKMYHQNPRRLLGSVLPRRSRRVGRNALCPCGSGQKYKRCCRPLAQRRSR